MREQWVETQTKRENNAFEPIVRLNAAGQIKIS